MVILLVVLSIVGVFIYVLLQEESERKSMVKYFDAVKTMSLEELFAANDAAENVIVFLYHPDILNIKLFKCFRISVLILHA